MHIHSLQLIREINQHYFYDMMLRSSYWLNCREDTSSTALSNSPEMNQYDRDLFLKIRACHSSIT